MVKVAVAAVVVAAMAAVAALSLMSVMMAVVTVKIAFPVTATTSVTHPVMVAKAIGTMVKIFSSWSWKRRSSRGWSLKSRMHLARVQMRWDCKILSVEMGLDLHGKQIHSVNHKRSGAPLLSSEGVAQVSN